MKQCPVCATSFPGHVTNCVHDGALLRDLKILDPDTVIRGKYRIIRLLGQGGMGAVYLAEHLLMRRERALKFMSNELSQDPTSFQRFQREAHGLQHPNVVQVFDLDQSEDGSPYIAMEFVDGPELRDALAHAPFPVEKAIAIARGVALGLSAANDRGIVHRDIKPENILLAGVDKQIPKLLDFGIAAMKQRAPGQGRTRGYLLTPAYAAPEQWRSMRAEEMDGRVDLYALGGVFYEMLTGRTCFQPQNVDDFPSWMELHLDKTPPPPSQLQPELANWPGLDDLVLRLLAKDRDQRPGSAAEVVGLLDQLHYQAPVRDVPPVKPPVKRTLTVAEKDDIQRESGKEQPDWDQGRKKVDTLPPKKHGAKKFPGWVWGALAVLAVVAGFAAWKIFAPSPTEPAAAQAPAPEFLPAAGNYTAQQTVKLTDTATQGLTIYYTTDGSAPTTKSSLYTGDGIEVAGTETIRAVAVASGYSQSAEASAAYAIGPASGTNSKTSGGPTPPPTPVPLAAPAFSPAAGIYSSPQSVQIVESTPNAAIYYTTDGTAPTASSARYNGAIQVGSTETISAIAKAPGGSQSAKATATYTIPPRTDPEHEALDLYKQQDYAKAAPLFAQTCASGNGEGCNYLGRSYELGRGVPQDYAKAAGLYTEACNAHFVGGCFNAGVMYDQGHPPGVAKDHLRAARFYLQDCDANIGSACNNLGNLYLKGGDGIAKDNVQAKQYLDKACKLNDQHACTLLNSVP